MRRRLLLVVVSVVAVALIPTAAVGGQETSPEPVSWLSTGDSYSSGEGVFGNEGDCAQSEDAWGRVAAGELARAGWVIPLVGFTACTGHLVEDFFNRRDDSKDALYEWGLDQGVSERVDVLTLSFGGNDIGFGDVISDCLVLPDSWSLIELGTWSSSCDISELELQERIDALVDPPVTGCQGGRVTNVVDPDPYACDLLIGPDRYRGSYVDFLVKLSEDHLTSRGRLVVAGYPQLFAPTNEWPAWSFAACAGVTRGDTEKLGRVAADFDAKLKTAVSLANQRLGTDRVIYVSTRELYREGSHELCGTGANWINGVTTTRGEGQTFRWLGSFHPNWAGHENTGQAVAKQLQNTFSSGTGPPTWIELTSAEIPEMCGHEPTQLVDGEDVEVDEFDGYFRLLPELRNGSPGMVPLANSADGPLSAIVAECNAGGVSWPNPIMFFGPGGEFYDHTFLDDHDWESIGLRGPGRNAITKVWTDDGSRLIVDLGMYGPDEGGCCWTGSAVVAVEAHNGALRVSEVLSYELGASANDSWDVGIQRLIEQSGWSRGDQEEYDPASTVRVYGCRDEPFTSEAPQRVLFYPTTADGARLGLNVLLFADAAAAERAFREYETAQIACSENAASVSIDNDGGIVVARDDGLGYLIMSRVNSALVWSDGVNAFAPLIRNQHEILVPIIAPLIP